MDEITAAFNHMGIAEEVIAAASGGKDRELESRAFGVMCPSDPLRGKSIEVYRAHCTELMQRVMAGEDTRLATKAEVLCGMMAAATAAPLNAAGGALADWLFSEVMPSAHGRLSQAAPREFYQGQVAEDFAAAQRKMSDPSRRSNQAGSDV